MKLLLDTNIVSYWMRGDVVILGQLKRHKPCDLAISSITLAEILYGIKKSPAKKRERQKKINAIVDQLEVLPFDKPVCEHYAKIRTFLEKNGIPISERDLQIAAIAVTNKMSVVTHNTREFSRVPDLEVFDWA